MNTIPTLANSIARISLRALHAILLAVYAVLSLLCRLVGIRQPAALALPTVRSTAAEIERSIGAAMEEAQLTPHCRADGEIALAVHRYASAARSQERATVDLTGLSGDQYAWLVNLSDADLQRLALAGVAACERALTGKRCGVIGLPAIRAPGGNTTKAGMSAESDCALAGARTSLHHRIRAARASVPPPDHQMPM